MDGVKPWQLAVIIIGLVGGLALAGWQLFGGRKLHTPDTLVLMDVSTGQRYIADVTGHKSIFIPEKNPDTQEYTLLPIVKGEDGKWRTRHIEIVQSYPPEQRQAFENASQGIASPTDAKPKRLN